MEAPNKRDGNVGDVWHGLMGGNYAEQIEPLIKKCFKSPAATTERFGDKAILTDRSHPIFIQLLLKIEDKRSIFQSIVPRFDVAYENMIFQVDKVDEWANGLEATLTGSIYGNHLFSFYLQNYLEYKNTNLKNKKVAISITVAAMRGEILPEDKRVVVCDEGPTKGMEHRLDQMCYLNPCDDDVPESCQFFFPIHDVQKINFLSFDVYKIKGILVGSNDSDSDRGYFYDVYIHPSLVKDATSLKIGEPFFGVGWLQAQITCVLPGQEKA